MEFRAIYSAHTLMNSKSFASARHTIAGPYLPFQTSILPTTHRYLAVIISFHFQV